MCKEETEEFLANIVGPYKYKGFCQVIWVIQPVHCTGTFLRYSNLSRMSSFHLPQLMIFAVNHLLVGFIFGGRIRGFRARRSACEGNGNG